MSWFSKHLGFKLDSHSWANALKNLSPVAGTIVGGPLGLVAAGGLSTLGDLGRGKNIGEAAKGAVGNVALAAGGQTLGSHFGYHGGLGSLTGGGAPATTPPSASAVRALGPTTEGGVPALQDYAATADGWGAPASGMSSAATTATKDAGQGLFSRSLDFAEHHPLGLNAIGSLATAGPQNRAANANARLLEEQADESSYDFMRRKQREADMAPLWGSLGTALGNGLHSAASNPYLPQGA